MLHVQTLLLMKNETADDTISNSQNVHRALFSLFAINSDIKCLSKLKKMACHGHLQLTAFHTAVN